MNRRKKAPKVETAWCVKCREMLPVGHTCASQNARDLKHGNRAVVPVRMDARTLSALDAVALKWNNAADKRRGGSLGWTRSSVVVEAVRLLLGRELPNP